MKPFVVVNGERKPFLFFFSDSNEHIKKIEASVPLCIGNTVSLVLGAILWASGGVQGRCRWSPHGLPSQVEPAFPLTSPLTFSFSLFKLSSGGLC